MPKTKQHKKPKRPCQGERIDFCDSHKSAPAAHDEPPRTMPYPYDCLERPLQQLSTVQRLYAIEELLHPSLALLAILGDLCFVTAEQHTTCLWPQDIAELLTIVQAQLREIDTVCSQWRSDIPQEG